MKIDSACNHRPPHKASWRGRASCVIAGVVEANPGVPKEHLLGKISDAYPFGVREMYPYKAWLAAVKEFMTGKPVPTERRRPRRAEVETLDVPKEQMNLM
jgi:hypothetical protein